MRGAVRRIAIEGAGWILVIAGIAALILPGPGLIMLAGGLIILSQQYEWAERRVEPIKREALKGAANSVETWPRIVLTVAGILALAACGVLWWVKPEMPQWYPLAERWWLPGGKGTGGTQIGSAVVAAGLLVWSYQRFHGHPDEIARVEAAAEGDDDRERSVGA